MAASFNFRQFEVRNERSALKVGTDAVLLGAAMTVDPQDKLALDVGTGTGVIALMAAQRMPQCFLEAVEIDGPSAEEAALNFANSPWADRLAVHHLPLADFSPSHKFDLIFSNPPFYDNSLRNPDERESVARHTESLSFRDLCAFAAVNLTDSGRLSLILPAESERTLCRTAASFGLYPFRILRVKTTEKKPVRRIIAEFTRDKLECQEELLVLQEGAERTSEYLKLTKEYYIW